MQCMNLCQEQCVNGQLPSDIYQFDGQNSNTHTLPAQITTAMQQPIQVWENLSFQFFSSNLKGIVTRSPQPLLDPTYDYSQMPF